MIHVMKLSKDINGCLKVNLKYIIKKYIKLFPLTDIIIVALRRTLAALSSCFSGSFHSS